MNIASDWELSPREREQDPPFPADHQLLDCGGGAVVQPGSCQFHDSTCGSQIRPLEGSGANSEANVPQGTGFLFTLWHFSAPTLG